MVEFIEKFVRVGPLDRGVQTVRREKLEDLAAVQRKIDWWREKAEGYDTQIKIVAKQILDVGHADSFRRGERIRWTINEHDGKLWRGWDYWDRLGLPDSEPMTHMTWGERMTKLDWQATHCWYVFYAYTDILLAAMEQTLFAEQRAANWGADRDGVRAFTIGGKTYFVRWLTQRGGGWAFEHLGEVRPAVVLTDFKEA